MTDLLLEHGSYLAIVIVLILTGAGLPIPEEVPVITAGVLSAHGQLNPWLAFACCLAGALIGDVLMYWIGYHFGRNVLRSQTWWARFLKPEREAKIERMMQQHGLKVLFVARFLVGLRSTVYLSAGILRVPFRRFLLTDLFCATTMIGVFFLLSYRYGTVIVGWIRELQIGLTVGVVLALLALIAFFWHRHRRRLAKAGAERRPVHETSEPADAAADEDAETDELDGQPVAHVEETV